MTPKSPSSPEDQTPPQRPRQAGSPAKPSSEMDLWSFDDDLDGDEPEAEPKTIERIVIEPREIETKAPAEPQEDEPAEVILPKVTKKQEHPGIRVNVGKTVPKARAQSSIASSEGHVENFDDLDSWDDIDELAKASTTPVAQKSEPEALTKVNEESFDEETEDSDHQEDIASEKKEVREDRAPDASARKSPSAAQSDAGIESEFASVQADPAKKLSLKLGLSPVEKIGIAALLVILVAGTAWVYSYTINRIPKHALVEKHHFPIKGKRLTLTGAETFWRKPITTGDNPDTPRAGTAVLPVLSVALEGGPADVRVFFRNEKGELVGDSVTRSVQANSKLQIAATAGFDDAGMYAAYQAGMEKPWTVEILEIGEGGAQSKLFQSKISTENR